MSSYRYYYPYFVLVLSLSAFHLGQYIPKSLHYVGLFGLLVLFNIMLKEKISLQTSLMMFLWAAFAYFLPTEIVSVSAVYYFLIFLISSFPFLFNSQIQSEHFAYLKPKRFRPEVWPWIIMISSLAAIAIILWSLWPEHLIHVNKMIKGLKHYPKTIVYFFMIPFFSLLNGLSEEVIFRGVIFQLSHQLFKNRHLANFLQATGFASIHLVDAFPNNRSGYVITLVFGFFLGEIRYKTQSIWASYFVNVLTSMIVMYFLCRQYL